MFESFYPFLKDMIVIIVTLGVFSLFAYAYITLRPTIFLKPSTEHSGCPDRWIEKDGMCTPQYQTKCQPYNPLLYAGQECEIAAACGTSFKGMCN
jgi:hypothetical protein